MVFIAHVKWWDETIGDNTTDRIALMADDFQSAVEQIEEYYDTDLMSLKVDFIHELNFLYLTESAERQIKDLDENLN